MIRARTFHFQK